VNQNVYIMLLAQRLLLNIGTLVVTNLVNVAGILAIGIYFTLWLRRDADAKALVGLKRAFARFQWLGWARVPNLG
jgi:hypothetical protein